MHRRKFLVTSSRAALSTWFLPRLASAQARSKDNSRNLINDLERLIPKLLEESMVPGLSIALVQDGTTSWRGAFGLQDSASQKPVDHETVFEAASVSKTVFAYAVLKLCDSGILALDTPLTDYTPQRWLEGDSRLELITARHLLSHTSGFQDWRSGVEPLKIHFTPGTKFLYSGEGYNYLQSVVTHLTGHVDQQNCARYEADFKVCATDIDPWLRTQLLRPLNMPTSGYVWSDAWATHAASPHDTQGKALAKKKPSATDAARYASAGGLHTTATQYARFLITIVNPKPGDAVRLSQASWKEMLRPQIKLPPEVKIDDASAWALGWAVQERPSRPVIVHSGGQEGFQSLTMASVNKKSGFVALTNSNNGWKIFSHEAFQELINRLL